MQQKLPVASKPIVAAAALLMLIASSAARADLADSSYVVPLDHAAIAYDDTPADDAIVRLQQRIDAGEVELIRDGDSGYLRSLLEALDIPVSSQTLVGSKTSFQRRLISPANPRALYFNDEVYIGYVRGGEVLEVSAVDPRRGASFYTLSQEGGSSDGAPGGPRFVENTRCLQCHHSPRTAGVPGHMVRSVFADDDGQMIGGTATFDIDHRSPFAQRWGGWYVTGTHGAATHLGNQWFDRDVNTRTIDRAAGANVTSLAGRFDPAGYLSGHSDIVALMVLEHQVRMHNVLARAAFEARMAAAHQAEMNRIFNEPADHVSDSTRRRLMAAAESVVDGLLFVGEPALDAPVQGTSGFAGEFAARGRRDTRGRSLRDFDLQRRTFKHPCSYLIHSEAFDAMPEQLKGYVHRVLWSVLSGRVTDAKYASLSEDDRLAIYDILLDTKRDLPEYWRQRR
jgi:hypothetical protein